MFDQLTTKTRGATLDQARCLFFDRGHDLAQAAARLGGAWGETRVVSCGLQLEAACCMTRRIQEELYAVYRLLALADVGEPGRIEAELFISMNPATREVEEICLLTDLLHELLNEIDRALSSREDSIAAVNSLVA